MTPSGSGDSHGQFDRVDHGPPPRLDPAHSGFGCRSVRAPNRSDCGVRIMLKGFQFLQAPDGEPIAFIDTERSSAVQAVQALRQAIADARKGRVR